MELQSFKSLALKYKVIFFDAYGVLKNHTGIIPGIKDTFNFLHDHEIDFYVLTNDASRSPVELAAGYTSKGIKAITEDKIISSGMLARDYLRYKVSEGTVAYLGTDASAHYIETVGLKTLSVRDLDLDHFDSINSINALVLLDDEGFNWETDLNKAINLLRKRNIPVIIANTDTAYPVSRNEIAVAIGGLGDMIEHVVRKSFIRFGKPDAQMFNFAWNHIQHTRVLTKNDILMVGDTLETDIMGGNHFGIDTALVLTGNTLAKHAAIRIESSGIIPDYICESINT